MIDKRTAAILRKVAMALVEGKDPFSSEVLTPNEVVKIKPIVGEILIDHVHFNT
jgi:hypothetical protein